MITSIQLSSILPEYKNIDPSIEEIQNLSRLTIFIGANNSGKSRFLRELLKNQMGSFIENKSTYLPIVEKYLELLESFRGGSNAHVLDDIIRTHKDQISFPFRKNIENDVKKVIDYEFANQKRYDSVYTQSNHLSNEIREFVRIEHDVLNAPQYKLLYIPLLRGLKPLIKQDGKFIDDDVYLDRIRKDYHLTGVEVFTGLKLYDDLLGKKRSKRVDRKNIEDFEKFLGDKFFQGRIVDITPNKDDDTVHISIDDDENPIYHVGDGIAALINILYPLFTHQGEKLIIGIEEPETHLHPSMQRILLETFMDKRFSSFQYFITTHSNHFLDMTLDQENISVYTFEKKGDIFEIDNIANNNTKSLELLGVRNSAVFLANCSIWVEGITDRIYLRKILELTQVSKDIKFNEDYHFTFIEYGGANITHWGFLDEDDSEHPDINFERISNKIFLVSDTDGVSGGAGKKALRFPKLTAKFGANFYPLQCREIENLLSPKILNRILIEDGFFSTADEGTAGLNDYEEYKGEYLGKYLEGKFPGGKYVSMEGLNIKGSGTIKDKVNFSKKAIKHLSIVDDLTPEAKDLGEKIYEFIKSHNS